MIFGMICGQSAQPAVFRDGACAVLRAHSRQQIRTWRCTLWELRPKIGQCYTDSTRNAKM